ncbi:MAG: hypothetical protein V1813_03860 [Candidatus Aenigmatarchaeota archaeon]
MLSKCSVCGRRLRIKALCMESGKKKCRKCCNLRHEHCTYKLFCWSDLNG